MRAYFFLSKRCPCQCSN
uniref:Uncharacterized protein n=1 Tax=Lepeophtheirus salmonis TaxID=72036 RepID=A0A0K2TFZ4_LEPSM